MTVTIKCSSVSDGTMKATSYQEVFLNRSGFLGRNGITPEQTCQVHLEYSGDDYCRYYVATAAQRGEGITKETTIISDALFTREKGLALFLPLADCIGMVVYNEAESCLAVAHLGRHNLVQNGGSKTIQFFENEFGVSSDQLRIYLSPAAGKASYPMFDFDGQSLIEVAVRQLRAAGVSKNHITIDERDTTTDPELYSHSNFLAGRQQTDGRHAIVAHLS